MFEVNLLKYRNKYEIFYKLDIKMTYISKDELESIIMLNPYHCFPFINYNFKETVPF